MAVSVQNKRALKQRTRKLVNSVKEKVPFSLNFRYVGSIKNPGPPTKDKDGYYDIDIDFIVSVDIEETSAQEVYNECRTAVEDSLRNHESLHAGTNAVISIRVDESGNKYKFDIAIFDASKGKKVKKSGTGYVWS